MEEQLQIKRDMQHGDEPIIVRPGLLKKAEENEEAT
jgi:hypothetical protein